MKWSGLALLATLLAACGPVPHAATAPACSARLPAVPSTPGIPLAIIRDVAGGPTEYLAGSPGGSTAVLVAATGFSPPQVGGQSVYFSVRSGVTSWIYEGTFGGCAHRVAEGTLGAVEHHGRAVSALVANHWAMLAPDGHEITRLSGAGGTWTPDGRLVEATPTGIDLYSVSGARHSIAVSGVSPQGILGENRILVNTATGVQAMDLKTGQVSPLELHGQTVLRAAAGSPDGRYVAFIDAKGAAGVLELATGRLQPITLTALPTGFAWSTDSRWVAVQEIYGGVEMEVGSGRQVDSGSQLVVSW